MERIREIIPSVLTEVVSNYKSCNNLQKNKRKQKVNLQDIKDVWEKLPPFFRKGEPKSFKREVLAVKAGNSSLLFFYSLQKERLIEELRNRGVEVKDIKFKIG